MLPSDPRLRSPSPPCYRTDHALWVADAESPCGGFALSHEHISDALHAYSQPTWRPARETLPSGPSRAVRLYDIRLDTPAAIARALSCLTNLTTHRSASFWTRRDDGTTASSWANGVWVAFTTHDEALAALGLPWSCFSVAPALESDLEHLQEIPLFSPDPTNSVPAALENVSPSFSPLLLSSAQPFDLAGGDEPLMRRQDVYGTLPSAPPTRHVISTNPPNPKTNFRAGDWICAMPNCAAHNFQRNVVCFACGQSRMAGQQVPANVQLAPCPPSVTQISPRFAPGAGFRDDMLYMHAPLALAQQHAQMQQYSAPAVAPPQRAGAALQLPMGRGAAAPSYPILTPSGRALTIGGRVQNISRDPLVPCIMYWPDNEPLPEQGQIRPMGSAVITYPPIINTGNKGAAEKQPGDWVCQKCQYLNWRRRKVCQICYPYAEGNGDSISNAVQAERIALLANLLANQMEAPTNRPLERQHADASFRMPLAQISRAHVAASLAGLTPRPPSPIGSHRRSSEALCQEDSSPIYQTIGRPPALPSYPAAAAAAQGAHLTLLPSFLQDIVRSPSLSPSTSTSSADLSLEEYAQTPGGTHAARQLYATEHARSDSRGSFDLRSGRGSIWSLDGEESRTLAVPFSPTSAVQRFKNGNHL
ncbi:hypothetical protein OBBRIDRAFT_834315 [Obba rivulosa]|uniref:RanBP2-type domain-containing protein n=1 Tax=Obba rivulosa TaxID=1052685 RepID=A0A8E2B352_9APHY|nr:hypothetical protein OBBRIDRAFT_834315 [Obba rivulosa]